MPDGTMVSFPIPSEIDNNTFDDFNYKGYSYTDILNDLGYKGNTKHCHADPDLSPKRRNSKITGWFPAFGQIGAAATYLFNQKIEEGDMFLFFGNFHQVQQEDNHFKYVKNSGDFYKDSDIQVVWGYLQIGEVISEITEQKKVHWHPHSHVDRMNCKSNIIYKATDRLSFDNSLPGAGVLKYDIKRVLTAYGKTKATWIKNSVYDVNNICANRKNNARNKRTGIYYSGIWQELVLKESSKSMKWARDIIK